MKVLHANKYNFIKGGADKYFLDLTELLPQAGVDVAKFSMAHADNLPDKHEKYFVSNIDFNDFKFKNSFKYLSRIIYSREAARKFEKLIKEFKPDLVHIHNIYHQISPSILKIAKKRKLPVIMHLHDYKYLCPNYKMYNRRGVCEKCQGGKYYNCAINRCVKGSWLKSLLAMLEMYIHHRILNIYDKNVDLFIAPTEFVKNKFIDWGGNPDKIKVLPYFIKTDEFTPRYESGDYFLYFGRLSEEKGIGTLIKAFKRLISACPGAKLKIVGEGPEIGNLKLVIGNSGLSDRVELTGPKYGGELKDMVKNSLVVVVPSEWYEVSGIVIFEANALGKPVIGSRIGGISENIIDGKTGLLFTPGRSEELADKMKLVFIDSGLAEKMGRQGRKAALKSHNSKNHISAIIDIYKSFCRQ